MEAKLGRRYDDDSDSDTDVEGAAYKQSLDRGKSGDASAFARMMAASSDDSDSSSEEEDGHDSAADAKASAPEKRPGGAKAAPYGSLRAGAASGDFETMTSSDEEDDDYSVRPMNRRSSLHALGKAKQLNATPRSGFVRRRSETIRTSAGIRMGLGSSTPFALPGGGAAAAGASRMGAMLASGGTPGSTKNAGGGASEFDWDSQFRAMSAASPAASGSFDAPQGLRVAAGFGGGRSHRRATRKFSSDDENDDRSNRISADPLSDDGDACSSPSGRHPPSPRMSPM
eukprot:CAMPEP_0118861272 /NCGR_PEP_ID=MMETSP1163-20130328/6859_1 /TAXON_ID=124430 /ORGANISM="Phaeomonas parva, Strain CCMP2877" /LENGTH=284 /DNA_ID=CAMNT_0006795075 /DNA_START=162 /DNA_END=1013 /DNA_ORIENTATION=+